MNVINAFLWGLGVICSAIFLIFYGKLAYFLSYIGAILFLIVCFAKFMEAFDAPEYGDEGR